MGDAQRDGRLQPKFRLRRVRHVHQYISQTHPHSSVSHLNMGVRRVFRNDLDQFLYCLAYGEESENT